MHSQSQMYVYAYVSKANHQNRQVNLRVSSITHLPVHMHEPEQSLVFQASAVHVSTRHISLHTDKPANTKTGTPYPIPPLPFLTHNAYLHSLPPRLSDHPPSTFPLTFLKNKHKKRTYYPTQPSFLSPASWLQQSSSSSSPA